MVNQSHPLIFGDVLVMFCDDFCPLLRRGSFDAFSFFIYNSFLPFLSSELRIEALVFPMLHLIDIPT